jgi:N-acyl-L-homoserine lactone synthetase
MKYGVVLFHTTSAALRAEKILTRAGLAVKLIPTPREFSSDCGIALRFEWENEERLRQLLGQASVEMAGVHRLP